MRPWLLSMSLLVLLSACDEAESPDAGSSMDAGASPDASADGGGGADANTDPDAAPPPVDAGMDADVVVDAGPSCGGAQHVCDGVCTSPMLNEPANGCRLGCGDPCPGAADAICNADGTCGLLSCTAMTCDELLVECGTTDDGCGTRIGCGACGGTLRCESGACICDGDPLEANDTSATGTTLTPLTDNPDSMVSVATATIHRSDDVDWFRATVANVCCGGDPVVDVSLTGLPAGEDYDLGVWYQCPDGDTPTCTSGTADSTVASGGCVSASVGPDTVSFATNCDSDGVLFVRVQPYDWGGSCASYRIDVNVR